MDRNKKMTLQRNCYVSCALDKEYYDGLDIEMAQIQTGAYAPIILLCLSAMLWRHFDVGQYKPCSEWKNLALSSFMADNTTPLINFTLKFLGYKHSLI